MPGTFRRLARVATVSVLLTANQAGAADGDIAPNPGNEGTGSQNPLPPQNKAAAEAPAETSTDDGVKAQTAVQRSSGSRFIEEVIVTSQKREENLQDVPLSVQAFSGELLDARGIGNVTDLPLITPGLTVNSDQGFIITFLRGVGSDAFLIADPSVAVYNDGVYFPFLAGLAQGFGDVERIEVLKGPQGTLFGRNAVGGAISIVTKDPTLEKSEVSMQASYASFEDIGARVSVNIPIGETVAMSVSALFNNADHIYRNGTIAGLNPPKEMSKGARVKLRFVPTDYLQMTLTALRYEQSGTGGQFTANQEPRLAAEALGIQPQTSFSPDIDGPTYFDLTNTTFYGHATLNTEWFDVKLLGSDQFVQTGQGADFDGSLEPLVYFDPKDQYGDLQSGELQIISNESSWGADWFKWIVGAYYFQGSQGFPNIDLFVGGADLNGGNAGGISLPPVLLNAIEGVLGPLDGGIPDLTLVLRGIVDTTSYSAYTQTTLTFTDWLSLTLGGRYQTEKRSVVTSSSNLGTTNGEVVQLLNFASQPIDSTVKGFRPKVSLELRPIDDTLVYLSWQKASKSAAFNVINVYDSVDYIEPEDITAYEVGVKAKLFDGLSTVNAAVFQYNLTNQQQQFISLLNGGAVSFENAQRSRIRGFDFDTTTLLFPDLVNGLVLTAGGALLDGEYLEYTSAAGYNPTTGVFSNNNDYSGNDTVRTPHFTGLLGLSKTWDLSASSLEAAVNYAYNSGYQFVAADDPISNQKAYSTVDARISYFDEATRVRLTVFGQNILDEKYLNGGLNTDFGRIYQYARPAIFGVRVQWDF